MDCRSPVEKRDSTATLWVRESALTLAWTGFYCFLGALHQGRSSFIMLRFALGDYVLQITKTRMLQMQGNDKSDWSGYTPSLEWLTTDFRELLQRYTLNICCLNSGWGSLSKSKPQSSLDIMQAWFPMGKPICGPGSCVLPSTCRFSEPGLSYIPHCHVDWFPIQNSCYIGTYAVEKSRFSNVSYVAQYKSLFTFLFLLLLLLFSYPCERWGGGRERHLLKRAPGG